MGALLQRLRENTKCTPRSGQQIQYIDHLLVNWRATYGEPERITPSGMHKSLSPHERNILELIAACQTNKEIARSLDITPETLKSHLKHIFVKLALAATELALGAENVDCRGLFPKSTFGAHDLWRCSWKLYVLQMRGRITAYRALLAWVAG